MTSRPGAPRQTAPAQPRKPAPASSQVWWCALVFAAVLAAYAPALRGGFLWDDAGHVTRPDLRSLAGLGRIWFEIGATQQYYPVLHTAFWIEHRLWGDAVLGYHLLNVLLHGTAACLFGLVLRRLAVRGAWFAALLFALHPVCVESVAWISEQKNTLSAALYLAAALAYLRFARDGSKSESEGEGGSGGKNEGGTGGAGEGRLAFVGTGPISPRERHRAHSHLHFHSPSPSRRWRAYWLATGLFVLALLTKTVTATLPAGLLVIFWWQRGRLSWRRDVAPLLPWFALGAAGGLVTAHFERALIGAQGADFSLGAVERVLLAGRVFWFYLGKLAWPADLVFIYPRWRIDPAAAWQWLPPVAALTLLAAGALAARGRPWGRGLVAAVLLFAGALFPVLGFVNVYPFLFSFVADHFQYLAMLPVLALAGAAGAALVAGLPRWSRLLLAGAVATLLGVLAQAQAGRYRDVFTLYEATLARNPGCWMAHNNLAIALAGAGRLEEAVPHLEQALALRPGFAEAENNLGDDLVRLGRAPEAIPHFERALQLQPRYAVAQRNLGLALAMTGRVEQAAAHFARAVQLEPAYADAEIDWAVALAQTEGFTAAAPHFERALALAPDSADAQAAYGDALAAHGDLDRAVGHYRAALELVPDSAGIHAALAAALRRLGRIDEAREHELAARRAGAPPAR